VDAFICRAPVDLVNDLLSCSKDLDLAVRGGSPVRPGVIERALEVLERWEAYHAAAQSNGGGSGAR
jgi:hypothetical protein